ncbi:MAG TPA: hypothetical protein VMD59_09775 [Acidimicrobiales bacterium]|nr:hypothetical protein [Acidimicrobiales bacterium]
MSGYIEAGYAVVLGSLALYGSSLLLRERSARRRAEDAGGAEDRWEPPRQEQ